MITAARRRIGQFWRHSSARVTATEQAQAAQILGVQLTPLFLQLPVNEQRHALDVLRTLQATGEQDGVLLRAALLHDMGKAAARFSILDRSLAVFAESVAPGMFRRMLTRLPNFQRRYDAYRQHAAAGAARLQAMGEAELAAVIAEHHAPAPTLERTRRLRQADGRN